MDVRVFSASKFEGEPTESEEMTTEWFGVDELPFDRMVRQRGTRIIMRDGARSFHTHHDACGAECRGYAAWGVGHLCDPVASSENVLSPPQWADDRHWFPILLDGGFFRGYFEFEKDVIVDGVLERTADAETALQAFEAPSE